jgi:hypothetical protein
MMATNAKKLLGMARPAVAIAVLWANPAWAQFAQQPVQGINTQITEPYNANPNAIGAVQTGQGGAANDAGRDSGPLRGISLRLSAGVGFDDNVFRTESNTSNDFFWEIRPAVYFQSGFGKHGFRLGYEGVFVRHFEFGNQDFDNHRMFAYAGLDLTRKLNLNLNGEVRLGHDPRGGIGTCLICSPTPDTWRTYRVGADLVIGRAISRAQIIPRIEYSGIRYTNNGQSNRDFDRQDYRLRGVWRFTPRLSGIAEGGYTIVDHLDPNNGLDRTETGLLGGIGWEATAKTSGEILIGTLVQDFDDPAQGTSTNFNWDVRVNWAPKPYSKVILFTRRRSREDAVGGIGHFLADTFGAGWRHSFTDRLVMNTEVDYTLTRYSTGRKDNYLAFRIELTHKLTRWLNIGARYRYLNRRSNIPGIDYDDNMILLELTAGLERGL